MEEEEFEEILLELSSRPKQDWNNQKEATAAIEILNTCFMSELSELSRKLFIAQALDEQSGLIRFILIHLYTETTRPAVIRALELIEYIVINFPQCSEPHYKTIVNMSLNIMKSDVFAKIKETCLKMLKSVIQGAVDLNVTEIITCFKRYLMIEKKVPPSVLEQVYGALGLLFEVNPNDVMEYRDWFLQDLMDCLRHEVKYSKNLRTSAVSGCFQGLVGFLCSFPETDHLKQIYEYMKMFSVHNIDDTKHVVHRSALRLFEKHSLLFKEDVYKDHVFWSSKLEVWLDRTNSEDSRAGYAALLSFNRTLVRVLAADNPENGKAVFTCYLHRFDKGLSSSNSLKARACLIGFGELACCQQYVTPDEFATMFQVVIKKALDVGPDKSSAYVEAIASFVSKSPGLVMDELYCLKVLSVGLIERYPSIDPHFQSSAHRALEMSFSSVLGCGIDVLTTHLKDVIYQGLIRSCVHRVWVDVELLKEAEPHAKLVSYKSYLNLWGFLLNMGSREGIQQGVPGKVFDSFTAAFLRIIGKLDLAVVEKASDLNDAAATRTEASRPRDFQIFVNCVDLFRDIVPCDSQHLVKWLPLLFRDVTALSERHSLVSGFYKILSTALRAADQLSVFEDHVEARRCTNLLTLFLESVLVKVDQHKGDLQVACLEVLLSAPVCLVEPLIDRMSPIFQIVLRVSSGYFPLLEQSIHTLERWNAHLPPSTMKPLLQDVLSHFDLFLQSRGIRDAKYDRETDKKTTSVKMRGKIKKRAYIDHADSKLLMLQRKFLMFLGTLDPDVTTALIRNPRVTEEKCSEHLTYRLPMTDVKPQIFLDELLPRVTDLALSCSDRKTRVTACELLHAITLVALGNARDATSSGVLTRLLRTCLVLGCDADLVIWQLFNPLFLQITHYLSGKTQLGSREAAALIDVLMEGVTQTGDSALRDFAAASIREFVVWSVKQLTPEELKNTPLNIPAILHRICAYALHPSYNKRLGAALAFNNIYTQIREETSLLETHWFDLFYHFVKSLKMCEKSEDNAEIVLCIEHIKRPLLERNDLFNKPSPTRKLPPEFKGVLLKDLVVWTFDQCADPHTATRVVCMRIVVSLASRVENCQNLADFVDKYAPLCLLKPSSPPPFDGDDPDPRICLQWLKQYRVSFEYRHGLLTEKALTAARVADGAGVPDFLKGLCLVSNSSKASLAKCPTILSFFDLLRALLEHDHFNWIADANIWKLIATAVFCPSDLGFLLHHLNCLPDTLTHIIRLLHGRPLVEWSPFYEELNKLICLPNLCDIVTHGDVDVKATDFLNGLKVVHSSGLWQSALANSSLTFDGNETLKEVFSCLFVKKGKQVYASTLESRVKEYLTSFLEFGFVLGASTRDVLNYLNNAESVTDDETWSSTTKGESFLATFKPSIFTFLLRNAAETVELVLGVEERKSIQTILGLLQHVYSLENTEERKDVSKHLSQAIYTRWPIIQNMELKDTSSNVKNNLLLLLLKNTVQVDAAPLGCLQREPVVREWLYNMLKTIDREVMPAFFALLPHLSDFGEANNETLRVALTTFFSTHRFFWTTDYKGNALSDLLDVYKGVFASLQRTGSVTLLLFLVRFLHLHEKLIPPDLLDACLQSFVKNMSPGHILLACHALYDECFKATNAAPERRTAGQKLLPFLLKSLPYPSVKTFLLKNLSKLTQIIERTINTKNGLVEIAEKMAVVHVVQSFYFTTSRDDLTEMKKENMDEVKMLMRIITKCADFKTQLPFTNEPELVESFREYRCLCFNTLCTLCSNYDDPKPYKTFLFSAGKNAVWSSIVDNEKHYDLRIDFDEIPKRRKILTNLRRSLRRETNQPTNSVQYLQSQSLFESTLNEDVTRFDFTHSSLRPLDSVGVQSEMRGQEVELELDSLNVHECMASTVEIIRHLVNENITPLPTEENAPPPFWLHSLLEALKSTDTSENTRLFILKLMCNLEDLLRPSAGAIVPVVVDNILVFLKNKPINYFTVDLIVMMIGWRLFKTSEQAAKEKLSMLVNVFFEKTDDCRADVTKHNLEIIRTIVEVWKDNLDLVTLRCFIFERLMQKPSTAQSDPSKERNGEVQNYINIHMAGILLANDIPPWSDGGETFFLKAILYYFRNDKKHHKLASEICGMTLSYLEKNSPDFASHHKLVVDDINKFLFKTGSRDLSRLFGVHKFYPKISTDFLSTAHCGAMDAKNTFLVQCLEMLLSHTSRMDDWGNDNFSYTIKTFLPDMLKKPDAQELTLRMIDQLLSILSEDLKEILFPEIVKLSGARAVSVRKCAFTLLFRLYDGQEDLAVKRECKIALLKGLTDLDEELQQKCFEFWASRLSRLTCERMLHVLREFYSPETEVGFLSVATRFMLHAASQSADYKLKLFENPITKCSFEDYQLLVSYRAQHSVLAPMFAQTLASQMSRPEVLTTASLQGEAFRLRATINSLMFQPTALQTQKTGEEGTFLADAPPHPTAGDAFFKVPTYNPLKRRFARSQQTTSSYFARREIAKKTEAAEKEKDRVKKRESHVDIYRSYRIGDFPDIEITHSHLLKPLEVLAQRDTQIAKQLLVALYSGIIDYFHDDEKTADTFLVQTNECFDAMLGFSSEPAMMAFVFQVALQHGKKLKLDSKHLLSVAKASGWLTSGALLLEQNILQDDGEEELCAKKRKGDASREQTSWLQLAELYHGLKELDVLRGIFLDKLSVDADVTEAIHCEAVLDWQAAANCYRTVLNKEPNSAFTQLYSQAYFTCLGSLSNWDELRKSILGSVSNNLDLLWSDPWGNDQLLPWLLKSTMMNSLRQNTEEFVDLMNKFVGDKSRLTVMNSRFCEELSLNYLLSGKSPKASYYIDQFYIQFIHNWANLNQWSDNLRSTKLLQLQTMSELQQIAWVLGGHSSVQTEERLASVLKRWERSAPNADNDLLVWDVKLTYRRHLLKFLSDSNLDLDHLMDLRKHVTTAELQLVQASLGQDNFYVMRKYLVKVKSEMKNLDDFNLLSDYEYCLQLGDILRAKQSMSDPPRALEVYLKVWQKMQTYLNKRMEDDSECSKVETFRLNRTQASVVTSILSICNEEGEVSLDLLAKHLGLPTDKASITERLIQETQQYLECALQSGDGSEALQKAATYLTLAKFRQKHCPEDSPRIASCILSAMTLGCVEARQLFCSILTSLDLTQPGGSELCEQTTQVPTWMFLAWTNQLLASLDSALFPFIRNIILRIASDYPNALRFSFRLSKEKYKFDDPVIGGACREVVDSLTKLLMSDVLYESFLDAMSCLASPYHILKYHINQILSEVSSGNWKEVDQKLRWLVQHLTCGEHGTGRGGIFKYVREYIAQLEKLKTALHDPTLWKDILSRMISEVSQNNKELSPVLKSYSPWLACFQAFNHSALLEIPGQYDGSKKPLVKYHVTISSFQREVLLLSSKCKPLRLTILGNDALEYRYMVKFGEDLRQDQRIQQVFRHVNHVLSENKQTLRFSLETYNVIPLSSSLGLIQWVDDTQPLGEVISSGLHSKMAVVQARQDHVMFLGKGRTDNPGKAHLLAYLHVTRDEAIAQYNTRAHSFPWDTLRKTFWKFSSSPEHFAFLRSNFATSHATMCLTHWLIGIGDRHTQNTLICKRTGRVVGIDFGYAFGFATQVLPLPELVPFRLTPQIIGLLKPLEDSGWMKQTMVHCLRALRRDPPAFLALLEVFAQEPSLDWLELARKQTDTDVDWYPQTKLSAVRRKLEGAHPTAGFLEDLQTGHGEKQWFEKVVHLLKGEPQFNIRARLGEDKLTEEQQVDCLVDLATDPHILAKTYVGWDPWL